MKALGTALWLTCLGTWFLMMSGCVTKRIDWDGRIGTYTHDDAIREFGPPDKSAQLSDGSTVADWMTSRGTRTATMTGGSGYVGYPHAPRTWSSPGYVIVDTPGPDRFLRLTFDPQGKLVTWHRVYK